MPGNARPVSPGDQVLSNGLPHVVQWGAMPVPPWLALPAENKAFPDICPSGMEFVTGCYNKV